MTLISRNAFNLFIVSSYCLAAAPYPSWGAESEPRSEAVAIAEPEKETIEVSDVPQPAVTAKMKDSSQLVENLGTKAPVRLAANSGTRQAMGRNTSEESTITDAEEKKSRWGWVVGGAVVAGGALAALLSDSGGGGGGGDEGGGEGSGTSDDHNALVGRVTGRWSSGDSRTQVSGTFVMDIDERGNVTGSFSGGSSGILSGRVDPNGIVSTATSGTGITASNRCEWQGTMSAVDGQITGNGTTRCSPTISGRWSIP